MRRALLAVWLCCMALGAGARDLTSSDVEAFTDGVMTAAMAQDHVAGAVVGIVADGQVVLLKGYGYSDIDRKIPVDPETTLFRPGSVTKLLTWVSLMQLEAAGKVDLHADVNHYLTHVRVPETFTKPITIASLMTHTPGFEDRVIGLFGRTAASMRPLPLVMAEQLPARVRPPGQDASYSNQGAALAGLIVQDVSGQPWADYIEQHVLLPLGMTHSTVRQPLPDSLADNMSKGYTWQGGRYRAEPFEFVPLAPAGGASATGADMIRLVQAFLGGGADADGRILSPESNSEMQSVLFRAMPDTSAIMHGFYQTGGNGGVVMGHGGDTILFHSELMILPERHVGWFLSTNSSAGYKVRAAFHRAFLDRYFPAPKVDTGFQHTDLAKLVGSYGSLRHSFTRFTKLAELFGAVDVARADKDELVLSGIGQVRYMKEIAPHKFKDIYGESIVTFGLDKNGRASRLYLDSAPVETLVRLSGSRSPALQFTVLIGCMLVFGWILVVWTLRHFTRRWVLAGAIARFRIAGWWLAFSVLAMLACFALSFGPNDPVYGLSNPMKIALLMPYVVMTLAFITAIAYLPLISSRDIGKIGRLGYLLVAASGIGFTWFMMYWKLLSPGGL